MSSTSYCLGGWKARCNRGAQRQYGGQCATGNICPVGLMLGCTPVWLPTADDTHSATPWRNGGSAWRVYCCIVVEGGSWVGSGCDPTWQVPWLTARHNAPLGVAVQAAAQGTLLWACGPSLLLSCDALCPCHLLRL